MGGRGASSGVSVKGHRYGTEYKSLLQSGNIKFVRFNNSAAAKAPMETMAKGRVYATVDAHEQIKYISFYDAENKRYKQIDVRGQPHTVGQKAIMPHVHKGYFHDEKGTRALTRREKKMVEKILEIWDDKKSGQ